MLGQTVVLFGLGSYCCPSGWCGRRPWAAARSSRPAAAGGPPCPAAGSPSRSWPRTRLSRPGRSLPLLRPPCALPPRALPGAECSRESAPGPAAAAVAFRYSGILPKLNDGNVH